MSLLVQRKLFSSRMAGFEPPTIVMTTTEMGAKFAGRSTGLTGPKVGPPVLGRPILADVDVRYGKYNRYR